MMTRKTYIAAARIVATAVAADGTAIDTQYRRSVANLLADIFEDDNARFDRDRFMVACGLKKDGTK